MAATRTLRILGLSGSLRRGSYNHHALHAAGELMPAGLVLEVQSLADVPLYNQDLEENGLPPAVAGLCERLLACDGLLIASPEYNFSVTGVLKNALDWLSRCRPQPLKDKPVAILSATQGPVGGARNQYELRKILGCLEALVLPRPEIFIGLCHTRFDAEGRLTDAATRQLLAEQMAAFERWAIRFAAAGPSPH